MKPKQLDTKTSDIFFVIREVAAFIHSVVFSHIVGFFNMELWRQVGSPAKVKFNFG